MVKKIDDSIIYSVIIMNGINYRKIADGYHPDIIKTLLVGEAPPPSGKRYFYLSIDMPNTKIINKDNSMPATVFNHYFGRRPNDKAEYEYFLRQLQSNGIFLIDIVDRNLKIRDRSQPKQINQENLDYVKSQIPNLRNKLKKLNIEVADDQIIFLMPRPHYDKIIRGQFKNPKIYSWIDFRLNIDLLRREQD